MGWCIGVDNWSGTFERNFGVEQKTQIKQSQLILNKVQKYFWSPGLDQSNRFNRG